MDTLPAELLQRIGRFSTQLNMSSFASTSSWILESVRPVLFESITIETAVSQCYHRKVALGKSVLRLLVRNVYFYFTPTCDISQWKMILTPFTRMRNIVLSMAFSYRHKRIERDNVHHFHDLVAGISSISTIRSLYVHGGDMPDVQFDSLDTIHLRDCSFSIPDSTNAPKWFPSTLALGGCDWTWAQKVIGTQNVHTLVIDWPQMRPVFKFDFPNIKSLVLQSAYPSISTL